MTDHDSDVVIVGGGPIGGTLACALAKAGLQVAVVDQAPAEKMLDPDLDGRTFAVSYGSSKILDKVGIWSSLEKYTQPILDIRISTERSHSFLHYDHRDIGDNPMGYMLEISRLRQAIYKSVQSYPNINWHAPNRISTVESTDSKVVAKLDDGARLSAKLCLAADGRNSQLRAQAGIKVTRWDYDQVAIVCVIEHDDPHASVAHEHFLSAGPFAVLPMLNNRSAIVWTEKPDVASKMMDLSDEAFNDEMQRRFGDSLGKLRLVGKRWSYPLSLLIAHKYIDKRLALVGDAAHVMHPIAGQGVNLGFRDVEALANTIIEAYELGLDIGSFTVLERYQRKRRFDALTLLLVTDGLNRLFSNDITPIRLLRQAALGVVGKLPFAKRALMRHAMGISVFDN